MNAEPPLPPPEEDGGDGVRDAGEDREERDLYAVALGAADREGVRGGGRPVLPFNSNGHGAKHAVRDGR